MHRHEILDTLLQSGVIAIVRLNRPEALVQVARAIHQGGLSAIEFTMTTPNALETIAEATRALGQSVLIGAGTVLDAETARAAILAGATFIVSPSTSAATIEMCHRYSVVSMPGALTPTEILTAWEMGADLVKLFPAEVGGPAYLKAVRAPLPHIPLVPTGGVGQDNAAEYIRAGAAAIAVGSSLVSQQLIETGDMARLTSGAAAL
jgi:2-dehydro-3-deoxyphosphogluconate aldolase/(4S)-4-hydroxy-2-oxoglutarate aldolase